MAEPAPNDKRPSSPPPVQEQEGKLAHFPADILGAVKVRDGLFLGDELSSQVNSGIVKFIGLRIRSGE